MDRAEALDVLSEELGRYRKRTYDELKALIGQVSAHETKAVSGTASTRDPGLLGWGGGR